MAGTLFFDGNCGMCTRAVYFILMRNRTGDLRTAVLQGEGVAERLGVPQSRVLDAARWRDESGDVYEGAEAVNAALAAALGTRLPLFVYRTPGVRALQDAAYRYVASHRYRFPGTTPYCESHPVSC
ncbi:thiol-disulfide oxidoreductase [Mycobacterium sp. GA-1199]|uniref:thiol-disulfide oxidoreductase DCC family protein n=1 Tax=Mycobacterium sp. GA-1199 TaxID=1772287 RepID=UPI0007461514|nr:DCC1-like thiol-disulfide oxidoreductase family protein [Mycobacterium sp. GA-1199]KUI47668.1 thiol-disulfide oxidoreductase [Mycobacterium sp. GA-1199]